MVHQGEVSEISMSVCAEIPLQLASATIVEFLAPIMTSRGRVMNGTRTPPDRSRNTYYKLQ